MPDLWFVLVCAMLTTFVVLDGFDLGAGTLLYALARTDEERKSVHAAVGPFWDGNEVWLLASGGSLTLSGGRDLAIAPVGGTFALDGALAIGAASDVAEISGWPQSR